MTVITHKEENINPDMTACSILWLREVHNMSTVAATNLQRLVLIYSD